MQVRFLLHHTTSALTEADNKGLLATNYAVGSGNTELVDLLMAEDPDFAERHTSVLSPIFYAAQNGYVDVLRYLIEKHGVNPAGSYTARTHARAHHTHTHTHARTHAHTHPCPYTLTDALPSHTGKPGRDGNDHSLLHTAAYSGKLALMQYLIDKGHCSINDRTQADITPILWACDGVRARSL
jgi:ankyrin repeat protein